MVHLKTKSHMGKKAASRYNYVTRRAAKVSMNELGGIEYVAK